MGQYFGRDVSSHGPFDNTFLDDPDNGEVKPISLFSPALADRPAAPRHPQVLGLHEPHELAAAQGFPAGYQFEGSRKDRVKQIGNAVPVNTARALCGAVLGQLA